MRFLCLAAVLLSACSPSGDPNSHQLQQPDGCDQTGVLFVSWTFAGQPPSTSSCAGIDHLEVDVTPQDFRCNGFSITPVICSLTRFRYDNVPAGVVDLELTSFDSNGQVLGHAETNVALGSNPTTPVALDLLPQ